MPHNRGMKHWKANESVDGASLNVERHANELANALALTNNQRALLCHEIGNILVPAIIDAERHGADLAAKQLERLSFLHHALARKGNNS